MIHTEKIFLNYIIYFTDATNQCLLGANPEYKLL